MVNRLVVNFASTKVDVTTLNSGGGGGDYLVSGLRGCAAQQDLILSV